MKTPHVAVSVTRDYRGKGVYSVKYMQIAYRADKTAVWHVILTSTARGSFKEMEYMAKQLGSFDGVPYIEDIRHGERITEPQKQILSKYGVEVKQKSKRKEHKQ